MTKKKSSKPDAVPSLSGKEAIIMDLLLRAATKQMYGLELVANSGGLLKRGTVYVTLSRMEEKGLIESTPDAAHLESATLPRRLYRATGFGRRVLEVHELAKAALKLRFAPGGAS